MESLFLSAKIHLRSCFSLTVLTRIRNGTISSMFLFFLAFDTPYCRKCFTFSLLRIKVLLFFCLTKMRRCMDIEIFINYVCTLLSIWYAVVRCMALTVMHILHNTFFVNLCLLTQPICMFQEKRNALFAFYFFLWKSTWQLLNTV